MKISRKTTNIYIKVLVGSFLEIVCRRQRILAIPLLFPRHSFVPCYSPVIHRIFPPFSFLSGGLSSRVATATVDARIYPLLNKLSSAHHKWTANFAIHLMFTHFSGLWTLCRRSSMMSSSLNFFNDCSDPRIYRNQSSEVRIFMLWLSHYLWYSSRNVEYS